MRAGFYGTYEPQFVSYPYVLGWVLAMFFVGAYLLRRHAGLPDRAMTGATTGSIWAAA